MINYKWLNLVLLGYFFSSSLGAQLFAQRVTSTYQPPAVYQNGQIINGPVVQGQRFIQGQRVIQGQVIQGQPVQGQPLLQGPIIQGRPIGGNIVQPQQIVPLGNQQRPLQQPKADAADRAKIAAQAKTIEALTEENTRLNRVEDTNNAMRKEYARLKRAYEDVSKELDNIKINQAMNPAEVVDADELQLKLNQLGAQHQNAVEQNGTLSGQVKLLTQENTEIKTRLEDLTATGSDMANLKAEMNSASTKINQLQQTNTTLATENNRLQGLLQKATSDNSKLNMRFSTLSQQNEQLRTDYQTATETNITLGQQVDVLSTQNRDYLTTIKARPANVPIAKTNVVADRRDSGATTERDQVLTLNAELENENHLLMEQIAELEGKIGRLDSATEPKESLLATAVPAVTTDVTPRFNILSWLIPFLLIGLTIGLYVFLVEENGGEVGTPRTSTRLSAQIEKGRH